MNNNMVTALIPLVLAAVGAVMYIFSNRNDLKEIGRIILAAGMFALAFALAGKTIAI